MPTTISASRWVKPLFSDITPYRCSSVVTDKGGRLDVPRRQRRRRRRTTKITLTTIMTSPTAEKNMAR